jgi:hypothetical protein
MINEGITVFNFDLNILILKGVVADLSDIEIYFVVQVDIKNNQQTLPKKSINTSRQ